MVTATALLTLAMQCAPSVHPDTISDIAKTESGFHPYAIAEIVPLKGGGSRVVSHMPKSQNDALKIAEEIKARKHRYSVGIMQITNTNFPAFNVTAAQMLDPCKNLSIAEKIITDCYKRGGSLIRALSCYYSGNFDTGQRPEKSFSNTSYIQRVGYVVPSTRQDRQSATNAQPLATVVYPSGVIRGAIPIADNANTTDFHYPQQIVRGKLLTSEQKE